MPRMCSRKGKKESPGKRGRESGRVERGRRRSLGHENRPGNVFGREKSQISVYLAGSLLWHVWSGIWRRGKEEIFYSRLPCNFPLLFLTERKGPF